METSLDANVASEEVLVSRGPITTIGRHDIEVLKTKALENERKRIRLCAHSSVEDKVHEMLIVHTKNTYVRPHRHLDKSESFHIIEGELDVVVFDDAGSIELVARLAEPASGGQFYYRLSDGPYHTVIIRSNIAVFHETTSGPFRKSETVFAPWSPDLSDTGADTYFNDLIERVDTALQAD